MVILIDTNIFLEYLLAQEKAEECFHALKTLIDTNSSILVSSFSLHSIEIIMIRKNLNAELKAFLGVLSGIQHIKIYNTTIEEDIKILELMENTSLDFDDSIQLYIAKKFDAFLLTLDRHFDNIKGIKICKPWEII